MTCHREAVIHPLNAQAAAKCPSRYPARVKPKLPLWLPLEAAGARRGAITAGVRESDEKDKPR